MTMLVNELSSFLFDLIFNNIAVPFVEGIFMRNKASGRQGCEGADSATYWQPKADIVCSLMLKRHHTDNR